MVGRVFKSFINWTDQHAAAIQAFAIVILVIITVWYAYETHQLAQRATEQVESLRDQTDLMFRPKFAIDLEDTLVVIPVAHDTLLHYEWIAYTVTNTGISPLDEFRTASTYALSIDSLDTTFTAGSVSSTILMPARNERRVKNISFRVEIDTMMTLTPFIDIIVSFRGHTGEYHIYDYIVGKKLVRLYGEPKLAEFVYRFKERHH